MRLPPLVRRYLGNTSWMMLSRVLRLVVAFGVSVLMARYLGKERFGRLNYAISFVMLFSALGSLGLNDIVVRELVRSDAEAERGAILGTATTLRLAGTCLMAVLAIGVAVLTGVRADVLAMMGLVCLSYLFLNPAQNLERFFEANVRAKFSSWAQVAAVGVTAATTCGLVAWQAGVVWFAAVKAVESATLLLLLLLFFPVAGGHWGWGCSGERARELTRSGWPLMLTGVFILIYMRIDQVMIQHFLGEGPVGVYAVAVRLSEAWYFVPSVVAASVFPAILGSRAQGHDVYRDRMQLLYEVMTWLGIGVAVPTTFLAPWVIRVVYGLEFADAAPILGLYVWAGVFVFQGVARGKWIVSEGLQRYAIAFTGGACLVNVALNLILIPILGLPGAAVATVVSCLFQTLIIPVLFSATRPSVIAILRAFVPVRLLMLRRDP